MQSMIRNFVLAFSLLALLLSAAWAQETTQTAPAAAPAADKNSKKTKEKEPKKEKESGGGGLFGKITGGGSSSSSNNNNAEKEQKENKAVEKAEREYAKMLANARKKYDSSSKDYDPDFKGRVDQDYKQKRQEHSQYAFQMNTFDTNDEVTTNTGDKVKMEDSLYDNPLVQDYVNRVGQSLVPSTSRHRFAFRVVLNPVPDARSLATGTVYVTTGYLSLVDNEAQLAYILGHEIAHIEKMHWLQDAMVANEMEDFNRRQEKIQGYATLGAGILGGVIGGASGGFTRGVQSGYFAASLTALVMKFVKPTKVFSWDRTQENEADDYGMKLMFDRNYDPREVPKLYDRLQRLANREPRSSDGFLAQADRLNDRMSFVSPAMSGWTAKPNMYRGSVNLRDKREPSDGGALSPLEAGKPFGTAADAGNREKTAIKQVTNLDALLKEKLEKGEIIGSSDEFQSVMADLKRDNGVRAFYFDMFQMALDNLREAQDIRSNDPYTHFYYGKVLHLTARTRAEKAAAMTAFIKASEHDKRGVLPGPWMYRAIALMGDRNPSQNNEVITYWRKYVDVYQQEHSGSLPPNMDAIYAYLKDLGDDRYVARPALNISTKGIDPIETAASRAAAAIAPAPAPVAPRPTPPGPVKK